MTTNHYLHCKHYRGNGGCSGEACATCDGDPGETCTTCHRPVDQCDTEPDGFDDHYVFATDQHHTVDVWCEGIRQRAC